MLLAPVEIIKGIFVCADFFISGKSWISVDAIFKKTDRTHTDNRICQNILVEISNVIKGLQNLKITYLNDTFVQSKLELIQEKFNVCKNNLSSKLTVSE